ncbi:hypothetical protein [Desulfonatronovibrio hydrogenovorans]|uniref:hypothetical protein n=1 Tax=Desulfonatronovibrio hydrogenovorans TaxID=53245 RepID=UPI00048A887C|nr:hypothetical protein [Desulfonatronovibrio hydrogenovorans]
MNNASARLDLAYDLSCRELASLEEEDIEQAHELAEERAKIFDELFSSSSSARPEQFTEKLKKLQKMQFQLTDSARKLHGTLREELKRVKGENQRLTGYKKCSSITPMFSSYLNKKG